MGQVDRLTALRSKNTDDDICPIHGPPSCLKSPCVRNADKHSTFMGDADRANVGDEVAYSYDVRNNGTTTLSGVQIEDDMVRTPHGSVSATTFCKVENLGSRFESG